MRTTRTASSALRERARRRGRAEGPLRAAEAPRTVVGGENGRRAVSVRSASGAQRRRRLEGPRWTFETHNCCDFGRLDAGRNRDENRRKSRGLCCGSRCREQAKGEGRGQGSRAARPRSGLALTPTIAGYALAWGAGGRFSPCTPASRRAAPPPAGRGRGGWVGVGL